MSPDGSPAILTLQGGLGNRATAGLLRDVGVVQPSLRIGAADDRYEREADRVADRVIRSGPSVEVAAASPTSAAPPGVQRMCSECEENAAGEALQRDASAGGAGPACPALEPRVASLRGRGAPLSPAQRGFFEPRFGQDFSEVRLHTGAVAAEAARLARARAFTVGRDIAFGAGEFRPESRSGRRLLAHELTHVVQQTPLVARRKPLVQRQVAEESLAPLETLGPAQEQERELAEPEPQPEGTKQDRTPVPGLLVADEAVALGSGQMKKSAFMNEVRAAACRSADAAFAGTEHTTEGCPYIDLALRFYERRSAERIEQDLLSYAPEAASATSAQDYIPVIAERVRQSTETYVSTGEITGIPDGLPSSLGLLARGASIFTGISFKARDGGEPREKADPRAVRTRLGSGRPLAGSVRSRLQPAFGRSFSGVRVHTGSTASKLSSRFNARAFTVGNHVAFGAGEYRPGTPVGDALIAHELAHVVQQSSAGDSIASMRAGIGVVGALERDADRSAAGVVASLWRGMNGSVSRIARSAVPSLRSGLRLQRCPASRQVRPPQTPAQEQRQAQEEARPQQTPAPEQKEQEPTAQEKAIDALVNDPGCQPTAIPLSQLVAIPGTSPRQLGWTKLADTSKSFKVAYRSSDKTCGIGDITEAQFNFDHLVHTAPGEHRYGNETRFSRECGKNLPLYIRVTPDASKKFKAGEVEHCQDLRRAFALSLAKFNSGANSVKDAGRFPATNVGDCTTKLKERITAQMGIDHDLLAGVWTCLRNKTRERDTKGWHDVDVNLTQKVETDAGCTKVIHELDPSKILLEVGKHPTDDLVKGCGE